MSWNVHLHVAFSCRKNDGVAALAKKHLELIQNPCPEAGWFLESLAARTGYNRGIKGSLSLWGMIGNHTKPEAFVNDLIPFWRGLLLPHIEDGPWFWEHILIFYEEEQSEQAHCYEVFLSDDRNPTIETQLIIKHHSLPFTWMGYF